MVDYNTDFNYFDDDELAKDWFNKLCQNIAQDAFSNQTDWIYMAGEKGAEPQIKSYEKFVKAFNNYFSENTSFIKTVIIYGFLKKYYDDDIEVPQSLADDYNDWEGFKPGEYGYMEGVEE